MIGLHEEKTHYRIRSRAIVHIDIPYASGYFTSDAKQSMPFKNLTTTDNNIFTRSIQSPGILIASGLDNYRIIPLIERTILHQKVTTHFKVDTIVIMSMSFHIQITYHSPITHIKVNGPERTFTYLKSIQQHILATIEMNQMRTKMILPIAI